METTTIRIWSPAQEAIFDWFARGTDHLAVRARAGTGKTTTILEGVRRSKARRPLVCAFNKPIATELSTRLSAMGSTAEARTLHALGLMVVSSAWPKVRIDEQRGSRLAAAAWADATGFSIEAAPRPVVTAVAKLAGLIKGMAPHATQENAEDICLGMDVEVEGAWAEEYPHEVLARLALAACRLAATHDGTIDFNDMVWLPVEHGWTRPRFDLIVVDEAQDMNRTQLELAMGLASGRIAVVGDDKQAIYAFRGADSHAIDRVKAELKASELPLTTTYRCPRAVVAVAQALVPDFMAPPDAPAGSVTICTEEQMILRADSGDFILSRVNAPLTKICLALLRQGTPARIQGRDIGRSLIALVKRMGVETVSALLQRLEAYAVRETERLRASTSAAAQTKLDILEDSVSAIEALAEGLVRVPELIARIESMFADAGTEVVCSSVHKIKGKEARRVFVLVDTLYCYGKKKDDPEEANIHYVAVTRAMESLVLVSSPKERR